MRIGKLTKAIICLFYSPLFSMLFRIENSFWFYFVIPQKWGKICATYNNNANPVVKISQYNTKEKSSRKAYLDDFSGDRFIIHQYVT